ncbi:TPA: peptide chain release factor-like protein [Legionella pneumophila]|uniref:peptide chain release factor family protein n=1 Tax=Legionella pneumophila TaxID=446 RepID=UPI000481977A|nr:peptide chain release factor-like protein [Legionella pneumophila]ANH11652.1 peptide chain release factor 1 [Legionella pneumophila]ANH14621.1 peptide chain release factor 1 [Legionella pneumophila]ANH17587.1 peptide chain release factor 1 [Legionella pneumophila]APX18468.1 peptide chain release factor 1 [Legionella pneumophila]AQL10648.1 peptide chain release factor 1 [Legionella pneumophila]
MIGKDKWEILTEKMTSLHIYEADLSEKFILGSGKGGQKLHKTASTVYLKHLPTGMEIKCQESRSREDNRYFARQRLCEKLQAVLSDEKTKTQQRIEKIKRQKRRRSRRAKQKMLDEKSRQSQLKTLRKNPRSHDIE